MERLGRASTHVYGAPASVRQPAGTKPLAAALCVHSLHELSCPYATTVATALSLVTKLLEPVGLERLTDQGYEWQPRVPENWHPSINETHGVFATSSNSLVNVTLIDPVVVNVTVGEIGIQWVFSVSPRGGWAQGDDSFTIQLVYVAVFTFIGGMGMGCATVAGVRANYKLSQPNA